MLRAVPAAEQQVAFDIVDVLDGFATLQRRSPTLGGSVPLRVAQACMPLLEGNAWGFQITLARRIELRRRFGGWHVEAPDELVRQARAALPKAVADGLVSPHARKRLERGLVVVSGGTISLFTGLYARPRPGVRLRLSATANRRSFAFSVAEEMLDDPDGWLPIVLNITPRADVLVLEGEVATLAPLPARFELARCSLTEAPAVVSAHIRFYDGEYFATKQRGQVARKYRDEVARRPASTSDVKLTVVDAGPSCVELRGDRAVFVNPVAMTATFDGMHVTVELDRDQLARYASEVRAAWQHVTCHEGALLYLTKYITPHPAGEPHFFTKPCALVASSPGVSTVIDGICGDGYDVLRGVVRTDAFHATPAVFQLWQPRHTVAIPRGAPLAQLFPTTPALADATFDAVSAWSW